MRRLFEGQRSIRTLAIIIRVKFGAKDKLLRNWGACVDTIFLTRVKKVDVVKKRVADLEESKNMHRVRVGRWSCVITIN